MVERTLMLKIGAPSLIVIAVSAVAILSGQGPAVAGATLLLLGALIQAVTSAGSPGQTSDDATDVGALQWRDSLVLTGWVVIAFGAFFSLLATLPAPPAKEPPTASGWWIFTNEWMLQLFSGTVGALLGAAVAAFAAVWVLNRTNAKQQELWDASKVAQDQRDSEARIEQDRFVTEQLRAQSEQIEKSHGREAARESLSRQMNAAADLTEGVLSMRTAIDSGEQAVHSAANIMINAFVRWSFDLYGHHEEFRSELSRWVDGLYDDARALNKLRDHALGEIQPEVYATAYRTLIGAYGNLSGGMLDAVGRWIIEEDHRDKYRLILSGGQPGAIARRVRDELRIPMPWLEE